jgi:cobalamin biosynthesis Mg chelatase CobN
MGHYAPHVSCSSEYVFAGRNIHALDPYRMPSPAALQRGIAAAQAILDAHTAANNGARTTRQLTPVVCCLVKCCR